MFSDASIKAIGAVAYLKGVQSQPTIPRLELCGAVLAAEMADLIQDGLDLARSYKHSNQDSKCNGWHKLNLPWTPDEIVQAGKVILKATQKTALAKELSALHANKTIHEDTRPNLEG